MSLMIGIMKKFWGMVKISDDRNHARQTEPGNIERIYDIPYVDDGNKYHLMDVYYPRNTDEKLPVIIDIHGGGWMYATKDLNRIYNLYLAKRGFTVFSISYRLVPDVTVYEQLQDVMSALDFIQKNMDKYPCDKENIMLTGDSAGGMLACYGAALLTSDYLRKVFNTCNPGMKLTAMLLTSPAPFMKNGGMMTVYSRRMWGKDYKIKPGYHLMDLDEIICYADYPPTVMITSSGDILALKQTRKAAALFEAYHIPVKLMNFPKYEGKNLPHVFSVLQPESGAGVEAIEGAVDFYKKYIVKKNNL